MNNKFKKIVGLTSCLAVAAFSGAALTACGETTEPGTPTVTLTQTADVKAKLTAELGKLETLYKGTTLQAGTDGAAKYDLDAVKNVDNTFVYYVEVAKLANFSEVTSVQVGTQTFAKNAKITLSIGNNRFIEADAWVLEGGTLKVAAPILNVELHASKTIKVNSTEVSSDLFAPAEAKAFEKIAWASDEKYPDLTGGTILPAAANDFSSVNVNLTNKSNRLEFTMKAEDVNGQTMVYTRHKGEFADKNTIGYGITNVETGNKMLLYPEFNKNPLVNGKIDYTVVVGDTAYNVNMNIKAENHVSNLDGLKKALQCEGSTIVLDENIENINEQIVIDKNVTINLNGKTLSSAETLEYKDVAEQPQVIAFITIKGATVTITGEGTITAEKLFTFTVLSEYTYDSVKKNEGLKDSKLIIENGTFASNMDKEGTIVYCCGETSTCEIKGGKFSVSSQDKTWLLNTLESEGHDYREESCFTVTGGTFTGFDPSATYNNGQAPIGSHDHKSHVPEGYTSTQGEGNWTVSADEE